MNKSLCQEGVNTQKGEKPGNLNLFRKKNGEVLGGTEGGWNCLIKRRSKRDSDENSCIGVASRRGRQKRSCFNLEVSNGSTGGMGNIEGRFLDMMAEVSPLSGRQDVQRTQGAKRN